MVPQTLLLGQVGTGVAVAYRLAGPYELIAFAAPVVAAQLSWRQYVTRTTRSVEELRIKNSDLIQLAARLQMANDAVLNTYRGTLEALVTALDARDNEVQGHSYRVSAYSQVVAEKMGIEQGSPEWEAILRGALLHDVGKIGVRDAVLLKPGKLDEREWAEMRAHSEIGFGILRDVEFLRPAATLVRAHHERFDGAGYPLGLKGEQIPLGARIFSVCDTFDAITTDRPYRKAAPPQAAVAEIRRCAGTQFDPAVVEVFEQVWPQLWGLRAKAAEMVA
jgi:HD-GYP domain-containing protein (c-di-GMP phosphodiesterase class II)